ncbi:hypothetical protein SDC9_103763 [bioreactor metagenome]|uniref:Uncharacterized protein n=1 Tax=bioreactor metagenome TaxID=1076179 RepID=A0A645AVX5_9ZZZZ
MTETIHQVVHAQRSDEKSFIHIVLYLFGLFQFGEILQSHVTLGNSQHKAVPSVFDIRIFAVVFMREQGTVVGIVPIGSAARKHHFVRQTFQHEPNATSAL